MIYICKHCRLEFSAKPSDGRVYCSLECKALSERTFDFSLFLDLVHAGREGKEIASALKISPPRVTRALQAHGLRDIWRQKRAALESISRMRRYQSEVYAEHACVNSLLAGWKLADGVSELKISNGPY